VPEFTERLPNGTTLNGLTPVAFQMVLDGYACGECLAMFDTFMLRCPACQTLREDSIRVQPTPDGWQSHLDERNSPVPYEKPPVVNPFTTPGEFDRIAALARNPEVETLSLKRLRPSKWGRGKPE
jgi:hypothetical protein